MTNASIGHRISLLSALGFNSNLSIIVIGSISVAYLFLNHHSSPLPSSVTVPIILAVAAPPAAGSNLLLMGCS
jgi:hypothetical protein